MKKAKKSLKKLPSLLVIAKTLPLFDRASGDYRLFQMLDILKEKFDIDYLSTQHAAYHREDKRLDYLVRDGSFQSSKFDILDGRYQDELKKIGVNPLGDANPIPLTVRPTDDFDIRPFLAKKKYDLILVEFFYVADQFIHEIRRFQPWATVICDSVDLHFRRLARQAEYLEKKVEYTVDNFHERSAPDVEHRKKVIDHRNYADHVREQEISAYERCDAVIVVSEDDRNELKRHCPQMKLLTIPNIHPSIPILDSPGFSQRSGCVFVGNFDHHPNVTGSIFLKHEVAPRLTKEEIKFNIVGSNPPQIIRTIGTHGVQKHRFTVTGYVPSTLPYLNAAKVSVAPILFGAGMNGKIGEAIGAGLPVVTTSLGALGMQLKHEQTCLIADSPEAFAQAIERLHRDEKLWNSIRKAGLLHLDDFLRKDSIRGEVQKEILDFFATQVKIDKTKASVAELEPVLKLTAPKFGAVKGKPKFSVVILCFNQWKHTELCLRSVAFSLKEHPRISAEVILVDNASSDETKFEALKIPGLIYVGNRENLGFAKGNNVGFKMAKGENIVVLNNDTVVAPDWLFKFEKHLSSIPNLGIIGPSCNTESGQSLSFARYNSVAEFFKFDKYLGEKYEGSWEIVNKISGLCMVIPRRTLDKIGSFDPIYGIGYFEDDDMCLRAVDHGLRLVWAKDIYVHHFGSVSFDVSSLKRLIHLEEGMSRFAFKWGKRGLNHIAKAHKENLLRVRKPGQLPLL